METVRMVVFSALLCSAFAEALKVINESRTAFLSEDFQIYIPSLKTAEVLFRPSQAPEGPEEAILRDGQVLNNRTKWNVHATHLILQNVGTGDNGVYVIKISDAPDDVKHITLTVKDCFTEQNVKYGESFNIILKGVSGPITLEFRPSPAGANKTAGPMVPLLDETESPRGEYLGRLSTLEQKVSLHGVTGSDEGSYTILDSEGKVKRRVCLNVKEHQNFVHLSYGSTLKINLILDSSKVKVQYTPEYDFKTRVILDQGELMAAAVPTLEGRLSVEGSLLILEQVRVSDSGVFSVTDLQGVPVSNVYLEVEGYKLPPVIVAVIALLSLLVFLLLVCLISCLVKVRRRAQKARAIEKIAKHAGKEDGDDFRQVVQEAYTRFAEESTTQSQCDTSTMKTEVDIKGLEVSKNLLEMSDSGVEFNAPGLAVDSDTDVTFTSPKNLVESDHLNSTAPPEVKLSDTQILNSKPSINQTLDSKPSTNQTPNSKPSIIQTPDSTPSTNVTPVSKPGTNQTHDPKPSTDQAPDSSLGDNQVLDSKPSTGDVPESKPSSDQSPPSKPGADQTSMDAKQTSDSKPSSSPAPEPTISAPPEAAQSSAVPDTALKSTEPVLSETPAPETNATPATEDHVSSGPASDANLDVTQPTSVAPDQDTSKESSTT
ncbi:uncharacterized protein si:dkeyp-77h1.4 isoform X2 [Megalops cyprinoides]|uniref:uncharacterized protein si:dkeyp-77h1.4 isoform X2 n=1 Tax=Megalops cyprinoides TaxID=118141 RepID=UPI0018642407|nr:uncharacterized protein si:dkeyp-77h1.4 isoform X2 [Megalops cyprinoides]